MKEKIIKAYKNIAIQEPNLYMFIRMILFSIIGIVIYDSLRYFIPVQYHELLIIFILIFIIIFGCFNGILFLYNIVNEKEK